MKTLCLIAFGCLFPFAIAATFVSSVLSDACQRLFEIAQGL